MLVRANEVREVEDRAGPTHAERRPVVRQRGGLRRVERPEPRAGPFLGRVPYLRRELPPRPAPHSPVAPLGSRGRLHCLRRRGGVLQEVLPYRLDGGDVGGCRPRDVVLLLLVVMAVHF